MGTHKPWHGPPNPSSPPSDVCAVTLEGFVNGSWHVLLFSTAPDPLSFLSSVWSQHYQHRSFDAQVHAGTLARLRVYDTSDSGYISLDNIRYSASGRVFEVLARSSNSSTSPSEFWHWSQVSSFDEDLDVENFILRNSTATGNFSGLVRSGAGNSFGCFDLSEIDPNSILDDSRTRGECVRFCKDLGYSFAGRFSTQATSENCGCTNSVSQTKQSCLGDQGSSDAYSAFPTDTVASRFWRIRAEPKSGGTVSVAEIQLSILGTQSSLKRFRKWSLGLHYPHEDAWIAPVGCSTASVECRELLDSDQRTSFDFVLGTHGHIEFDLGVPLLVTRIQFSLSGPNFAEDVDIVFFDVETGSFVLHHTLVLPPVVGDTVVEVAGRHAQIWRLVVKSIHRDSPSFRLGEARFFVPAQTGGFEFAADGIFSKESPSCGGNLWSVPIEDEAMDLVVDLNFPTLVDGVYWGNQCCHGCNVPYSLTIFKSEDAVSWVPMSKAVVADPKAGEFTFVPVPKSGLFQERCFGFEIPHSTWTPIFSGNDVDLTLSPSRLTFAASTGDPGVGVVANVSVTAGRSHALRVRGMSSRSNVLVTVEDSTGNVSISGLPTILNSTMHSSVLLFIPQSSFVLIKLRFDFEVRVGDRAIVELTEVFQDCESPSSCIVRDVEPLGWELAPRTLTTSSSNRETCSQQCSERADCAQAVFDTTVSQCVLLAQVLPSLRASNEISSCIKARSPIASAGDPNLLHIFPQSNSSLVDILVRELDVTPPTAVILSQREKTEQMPLEWEIYFDEAISSFSVQALVLQVPEGSALKEVRLAAVVENRWFKVQVFPNYEALGCQVDGEYVLGLIPSLARDVSGNALSEFNNRTIFLNTPPTVIVTRQSPDLLAPGSSVQWSIVFNKPVQHFQISLCSLISTVDFPGELSLISVDIPNRAFTVDLKVVDEGTFEVRIEQGVVADFFGALNVQSNPGEIVTVNSLFQALVAYLTFDKFDIDSSDALRDNPSLSFGKSRLIKATLRGTFDLPTGKFGEAIMFGGDAATGVGGNFSLDQHTDPKGGSFTISFWFRFPTLPSSEELVIGEGFEGGSSVSGWWVTALSGSVTVTIQNAPGVVLFETREFQDTDWHHLAVVIDRTQEELVTYLDAVPTPGQVISSLFNIENRARTLEAGFVARVPQASVLLDDVVVWTRSVTPCELTQIYTRGQHGVSVGQSFESERASRGFFPPASPLDLDFVQCDGSRSTKVACANVLKIDLSDSPGHIWLAKDDTAGQSLVFDLRRAKPVTGFRIRNTRNSHHRDRGTKEYTISVSLDASKWTPVVRGVLRDVRSVADDQDLFWEIEDVSSNETLWGFESGTLDGWLAVETTIGNSQSFREGHNPAPVPSRFFEDGKACPGPTDRCSVDGKFFLVSNEGRLSPSANDQDTGILESPVFTIGPNSFLSFKLAGRGDSCPLTMNTSLPLQGVSCVTLEALVRGHWLVIFAAAPSSDQFAQVTWDLKHFQDRTVRVRVYDLNQTGYIAADSFSLSSNKRGEVARAGLGWIVVPDAALACHTSLGSVPASDAPSCRLQCEGTTGCNAANFGSDRNCRLCALDPGQFPYQLSSVVGAFAVYRSPESVPAYFNSTVYDSRGEGNFATVSPGRSRGTALARFVKFTADSYYGRGAGLNAFRVVGVQQASILQSEQCVANAATVPSVASSCSPGPCDALSLSSFTDTDDTKHAIGGRVAISRLSDESRLLGYRVYLASGRLPADRERVPIAELSKQSPDPFVLVPAGTSILSAALIPRELLFLHLVAFASDGDSSVADVVQFEDLARRVVVTNEGASFYLQSGASVQLGPQ